MFSPLIGSQVGLEAIPLAFGQEARYTLKEEKKKKKNPLIVHLSNYTLVVNLVVEDTCKFT